LRIYTKVEIVLESKGNSEINVKDKKATYPTKIFDNLYQKQFINYTNNKKYMPISDEGRMLVIAHPNFIDAMHEFVTWKRQRGLDIEMINLDSIGTVNYIIKNFVDDYYYEKGLAYLLLVGDSEHIPPMNKSGDSDAAYGHIEGTDSYAEVFVGRFSAQSELDLAMQIQRTIYYERDIDTTANWLSSGIGIASNEGGVGIGDDDEKDKVHMDFIREDLLNFGYLAVDQIYDPGAYATKVADAINEGRGVINYVGHGSDTEWVTSSFDVSDINNLTNDYKYPYIFDVACVNGNFKGRTCFAEAFVRAHHDSIPTGAVAIIASTINQDWAPPMDAQDEMIDILIESYDENIKRSFGGVTINGCMHMNDNYSSGSAMTNTWTIFGDPSVILRTKQPQAMNVVHSQVIITGSSEFVVYCDAENALAVLSNNDSILAKAFVENGEAVFNVSNFVDDSNVVLTITAYNKVSYQASINVVTSDEPYILVKSVSIQDGERIENGKIDYNQDVTLNFTLENVGLTDAYDLSATLIQHADFIDLHNNCENQFIGNIASGSVIHTENKFTITIAKEVLNQSILELELMITSEGSEESWNHHLNFKVNAPTMEISDYSISEIEGNNNFRIDAGELISLTFNIKNSGDAAAIDIKNFVEASSPYLTFTNSEFVISTIEAGADSQIVFEVLVNESAPLGSEIPIVILTNVNDIVVDTQLITVGVLPLVNVGDGIEEAKKYPFYNYYNANCTQIIYTTEDLGAGEKTFDAISMFLTRFTEDESRRMLSNFTIKAWHVTASEFTSGYLSSDDAITLYSGDYLLPGNIGEVVFNHDEFIYNGSDNLVIELSWGENSYFAGSDSFLSQCTESKGNTVAYGYEDNTSSPEFKGVANLRPNTVFHFKVAESFIRNVEFDVVHSLSGVSLQNAKITIGTLLLLTNNEGKAFTTLANGNYKITVDIDGYNRNQFDVEIVENNQLVELELAANSIVELTNEIIFYPNPASSSIHNTISGAFRIFDFSGKLVLSKNINSPSEIDISHLSKGIYIINIENIDFSHSSKLVIE